jgi:sulfate adenylyltransferase
VRTPTPRQNVGALVPDERAAELRTESAGWPSLAVAGRELADLECFLSGLLWPCTGYAAEGERSLVRSGLRLPAPEVTRELAQGLQPGDVLALRDGEGVLLAALHVTGAWAEEGAWRVSGTVEGVSLPAHHDFHRLRLAPADVAAKAHALGWQRLLAFFPGQVLHAGVRAALTHLASQVDAAMLLLIADGPERHEDLSFVARVKALEASAGRLPADRTLLVLTPVRFTADADHARTLRAVVAGNYGARELAVDMGAVPEVPDTLYREAAAHDARLLPLTAWGFDPERRILVPPHGIPGQDYQPSPSEAQILSWIATAQDVPRWLLSTEEINALQRVCGSQRRRGFTVFFTGLSGSGKSTIAGALRYRLMEMTGRPVTLLDGDEVRSHLSSELGFSRDHRDLNIRRIGWVAAEITRHGGIAVCAPIAPYDGVRQQVRAMIEGVGGFVLVHVATPLEVCEGRDRKGLYARARAGIIPQFTGVSDPYEVPVDAAVSIDTTAIDVDAACGAVIEWLQAAGYLAP